MDDRIRNSPFWFTTLRGTPVLGMEDVVVPVSGIDDEIHEDDIVRVDPLTVAWMAGLFPQPTVDLGSIATRTGAAPTPGATPGNDGPGVAPMPGTAPVFGVAPTPGAAAPGAQPVPGQSTAPRQHNPQSFDLQSFNPQAFVPGASVWDQPSAPVSTVLPPSGMAAPGVGYPDSMSLWGTLPPAAAGAGATAGDRGGAASTPGTPAPNNVATPPGMPSWFDSVRAAGFAPPSFPQSASGTPWPAPPVAAQDQWTPDAPPAIVPELTPAQHAALAREEWAARSSRFMKRGAQNVSLQAVPGDVAPQPADGSQGEPDFRERMRLNALDSYYRNTLAGSARLAILHHATVTPDAPGINEATKRVNDQMRAEYDQIKRDLDRYDAMRRFENPSEFVAAGLGQIGASMLSPEAFIGPGVRGANWLWRAAKAGGYQALTNLATDPVVQGLSMKSGVQDSYDPARTALNAGLGFVTGAATHSLLDGLANLVKGRPAEASSKTIARTEDAHQSRIDEQSNPTKNEGRQELPDQLSPREDVPHIDESDGESARGAMRSQELQAGSGSIISPRVAVSAKPNRLAIGSAGHQSIAAPHLNQGLLFDFSRLHEFPDVRQFSLPRPVPARGVPQYAKVIEQPANLQRLDASVMRGIKEGGLEWYNTQPLREWFHDELGENAGEVQFARWINLVGATSPFSTVEHNVRTASYYNQLLAQGGAPQVPRWNGRYYELPQPLPPGYGHLAQGIHALKVNELLKDHAISSVKNGKIASFIQNLQGNYWPVTIDRHNARWVGVRNTKGNLVDAPSPKHYGYIESIQQNAAKNLGLPPAVYQAAGWIDAARQTGLRSSAAPWLQTFADTIARNASMLGVSSDTLLREFIRGNRALMSLVGMLTGAGLNHLTRDRGTDTDTESTKMSS